ncbi:hypothetical protein LIER_30017 [Lithospermum erythrorhizon]|uniref:Uncharacterized protein n=1 Tax=Lithospermum erythrorhizon TaxID=34254 RepID=A0AAV3RPV5_LITER
MVVTIWTKELCIYTIHYDDDIGYNNTSFKKRCFSEITIVDQGKMVWDPLLKKRRQVSWDICRDHNDRMNDEIRKLVIEEDHKVFTNTCRSSAKRSRMIVFNRVHASRKRKRVDLGPDDMKTENGSNGRC